MPIQHLTTVENVRTGSRDIAKTVKDEKILLYIDEAEQLDIKPRIGDTLYLDILRNPESYNLLLDGGTYTGRCHSERQFNGLRKALNYFTYARLVKSGDVHVTRFSNTYKDADESTRLDFKEKIQVYNDAASIGERYLLECLQYLKDNCELYPLYKGGGKLRSNRVVYRVLGD